MLDSKPLRELLVSGSPVLPTWAPMSWGIAALVEAHHSSIGFPLPLVLVLPVASYSVILWPSLVDKGYRTGWIRLREGGTKKKQTSTKGISRRHVAHPIIAVGKKEWFVVKRDMRESLVFMPLIFFIIFPIVGFVSRGAKLSDLR